MKKAIYALLASIILILALSCDQHQLNNNMLPVTTKSDSAAVHYFNASNIFHYEGFPGMFESLEKAVEKDPNFFMAYSLKAAIYDVRGNAEQFEKTAKQALDCDIRLNKAEKVWKEILEAKLADSESDVTSITQKFIELYPDVPEAYVMLGFYYSQAGDNDKAVETYKKAVELAEDFPGIYNNLGYALMGAERYEEAGEVLDKYLEMMPDAPNAHDSKGDYYMAIGDYKSAYESYMKAHELGWGDRKAQEAKEKMEEAAR